MIATQVGDGVGLMSRSYAVIVGALVGARALMLRAATLPTNDMPAAAVIWPWSAGTASALRRHAR